MDFDAALTELDLELPTTADQIEERYKTLARTRHPDHGGTHESMSTLNKAREIALAGLELRKQLVPQEVAGIVATTLTHLEEQRLLDVQIARRHEQLRLDSTNGLRRVRRTAVICGAILAAAIFFRQELPLEVFLPSQYAILERILREQWPRNESELDELVIRVAEGMDHTSRDPGDKAAYGSSFMNSLRIFDLLNQGFLQNKTYNKTKQVVQDEGDVVKQLDRMAKEVALDAEGKGRLPNKYRERVRAAAEEGRRELSRRLSMVFFGIALLSGTALWICTSRIEEVERQLQELQRFTATRTLLHQLLKEIIGDKVHGVWTLDDLAEAVSEWNSPVRAYRRVVKTMGAVGFAELLMEHGRRINLVTVQSEIIDGTFAEYYSVVTLKEKDA